MQARGFPTGVPIIVVDLAINRLHESAGAVEPLEHNLDLKLIGTRLLDQIFREVMRLR